MSCPRACSPDDCTCYGNAAAERDWGRQQKWVHDRTLEIMKDEKLWLEAVTEYSIPAFDGRTAMDVILDMAKAEVLDASTAKVLRQAAEYLAEYEADDDPPPWSWEPSHERD